MVAVHRKLHQFLAFAKHVLGITTFKVKFKSPLLHRQSGDRMKPKARPLVPGTGRCSNVATPIGLGTANENTGLLATSHTANFCVHPLSR